MTHTKELVEMANWRDERRRYRQYQARKGQLPASHLEVIDAVERYVLRFGPGTGDAVVPLLEDLLAAFERSVADRTSVGDLVGGDSVEFAESFLRRYPASRWVDREQQRLSNAVERAARQGASVNS